jgi:hypothetical protein
MANVSQRLLFGCLQATISDVVDANLDFLPPFELAAVPILGGAEQPAVWPEVRRRLRAEGIRSERHRGVILLPPGELDHFISVGFLEGGDELFLCSEWNEEFEPFPGRITRDISRFEVDSPLGLEEWMVDAGCVLALGDGDRLNFATLDSELSAKLQSHFRPVRA